MTIQNEDKYLCISYLHHLNYPDKKELTLNGVYSVKTITEYFGGKFSLEGKPEEFKVIISLPIVNTEYNFKNQGYE
jgi:hypothetical protein